MAADLRVLAAASLALEHAIEGGVISEEDVFGPPVWCAPPPQAETREDHDHSACGHDHDHDHVHHSIPATEEVEGESGPRQVTSNFQGVDMSAYPFSPPAEAKSEEKKSEEVEGGG